jgi:uncharacterized NAD(P)/FAD-binding protein YdhS
VLSSADAEEPEAVAEAFEVVLEGAGVVDLESLLLLLEPEEACGTSGSVGDIAAVSRDGKIPRQMGSRRIIPLYR